MGNITDVDVEQKWSVKVFPIVFPPLIVFYSNAQKPCATCAKSHRLAVAANPTLAGTEPECTFDEFTPDNPPPPPEGPRAKYQRLESRISACRLLFAPRLVLTKL
jgi:hypothetical protein